MKPSIPLIAILAVLAGCGSDDSDRRAVAYANEPVNDSADWLYRSSRGAEGGFDANELEADLHGLYTVAPDRALVMVRVDATGPERAATMAQLRHHAELVREQLSAEHCTAEVVDWQPLSRAGDRWSGRASLRLDVPLAGLGDAEARFSRVEACMQRFGGLDRPPEHIRVAVSDPLLTVDDPDAHRATLLQRALDERREMTTIAELPGAPRLRACTSTGSVSITRRSLRGIALRLDMTCGNPGA